MDCRNRMTADDATVGIWALLIFAMVLCAAVALSTYTRKEIQRERQAVSGRG